MKFRYSGEATVLHLNARKEGPDDDKVLAVDLKLHAVADAAMMLGFFEPLLGPVMHLPNGAVRSVFLGPVHFAHELENYAVTALGSTFTGAKVKKFALTPLDGGRLDMVFGVSFKPSGDEVARLAEYLADDIDVLIEPQDGEFDLDAPAPASGRQAPAPSSDSEEDPLQEQALALVIDQQRASISMVQRHLKIGYNRAARLLEALEYRGVVSSMSTNGTREVLVSVKVKRAGPGDAV